LEKVVIIIAKKNIFIWKDPYIYIKWTQINEECFLTYRRTKTSRTRIILL